MALEAAGNGDVDGDGGDGDGDGGVGGVGFGDGGDGGGLSRAATRRLQPYGFSPNWRTGPAQQRSPSAEKKFKEIACLSPNFLRGAPPRTPLGLPPQTP